MKIANLRRKISDMIEAIFDMIGAIGERIVSWAYEHRYIFAEFGWLLVRVLGPGVAVVATYYLLLRTGLVNKSEGPMVILADSKFPLPLDNAFRKNPAGLAGVCILIAFLTAAFVQILKSVGGMRARVHHVSLDGWLRRRLRARHLFSAEPPWRRPEVGRARREIEELCAAGTIGSDEFYDLPTTQFCGQIGSAVDLVMMAPKSYPSIFAALTSGGREEHREALDDFVRPTVPGREGDDYDRLRARVINYAQRALDGLQLDAARRWRNRLMLATIQASVGISVAVVFVISPPRDGFSNFLLFAYSATVCAVAGALLAPVAHDVISAIQAFARR